MEIVREQEVTSNQEKKILDMLDVHNHDDVQEDILAGEEDDTMDTENMNQSSWSLPTDEQNGSELIERMKLAIIEKRSEVEVKYLLEKLLECKTNKKYFKQESASLMFSAVTNGAENVIAYLVQAGAQRYDLNSEGDTDILLAIRYKQTSVLKALLNFKQNINSKNRKGHFPLFLATEFDMVESVKLLLEAGANVNVKLGHSVKMLNENYSPKHNVGILGDTVAHLIVRRMTYCEPCNQDLFEICCEMLLMILGAKYCKSVTNSKGHTLFDEVIINKLGYYKVVNRLLEDQFPIQVEDPFHHACCLEPNSSVLILQALKKIHGGANMVKILNEADSRLQPLFVACGHLNVPAVDWLLKNGANPNSTLLSEVNAFEHINFLGCSLGYAVRSSTGLSPMHIVASLVKLSSETLFDVKMILNLLIKHGANINATNSTGVSPLSCALMMVKSQVNIALFRSKDPDETLIFEVMSVILLLLQSGANPDICFSEIYQTNSILSRQTTLVSKLVIQKFTHRNFKMFVMMLLEMSTTMAKDARTTVEDLNKQLCHLGNFVPENMIDRCLKQPRSLMVLSRKVILHKSKGRHLFDVEKHLHMLPVRLQDYVCMKYLLDPQWYIDQA